LPLPAHRIGFPSLSPLWKQGATTGSFPGSSAPDRHPDVTPIFDRTFTSRRFTETVMAGLPSAGRGRGAGVRDAVAPPARGAEHPLAAAGGALQHRGPGAGRWPSHAATLDEAGSDPRRRPSGTRPGPVSRLHRAWHSCNTMPISPARSAATQASESSPPLASHTANAPSYWWKHCAYAWQWVTHAPKARGDDRGPSNSRQ
jgi:hypothetical protein